MRSKRGIFFSTDALVAISIILVILLIAFPTVKYTKLETEIHYDYLSSLSSLKVSEADNDYLQNLIDTGVINNTNKSILEQIGEFYVTDVAQAKALAEAILEDTSTNQNIGIWFVSPTGSEVLIYISNSTPFETAENIETARQEISGIQEGGSVSGFSARSFLTSGLLNKYYYLGGYVGDGNISIRANITGNVTSAEIELTVNNDFEIYVNGVSDSTTYTKSISEFIPVEYTFSTTNFTSGINTIELRGTNLHVAGGFIKITYQTSELYEQPTRYYFPGINGLINIYDSFYIPNDLNELTASLHLNTNYTTFLTIGNTTVYKNTTQGEQTITLSNSFLQNLLDYNSLSQQTIPLRLGLENVSFVLNTSKNSDVISVTDLSGSMGSGTPPKIDQAIESNRLLLSIILNHTGNRVGLVGYDTSAQEQWFHNISEDNESLNSILDNYVTGGGTCICCGINRATAEFAPKPSTLNKVQSRTSSTNDDAEERSVGSMESLSSSDLELVQESSTQTVGMRFLNINLSRNTLIASAYIEFEADETDSGVTHLTFSAENHDNASAFSSSNFDITSRTRTMSSITWSNVSAWNSVSQKHQTPDLSPIIQEVINRPGWSSGNSIVIIVNGTGKRVAESYDGESANAPLLVISYMPGSCGNGSIDPGEQCDDGNTNDYDACTNQCTVAVCGDGSIYNSTGVEQCDDNNTINGDGCSSTCQLENRFKAMIVLSDGQANYECSEQNTGNPDNDAIQAACDAKQGHDITVHSVAFGTGADIQTLTSIAQCGNGTFYSATEVEDLGNVYTQIANSIIEAQFVEQSITSTGNISTILYPDSYIEFNYTKEPNPFGLIITTEKMFENNFSGSFTTPPQSSTVETRATSYSGPRWTDIVKINNNTIYNISDHGEDYIKIGDPYIIQIPKTFIQQNNTIDVSTGISALNSTQGSEYNKIIHTIVKNASAYSQISATSSGCAWTIQFEDNTNLSINVPSTYTGSDNCEYSSTQQQHNNNDAAQNAISELLQILDLDSNNKIDLKFSEQDIQIELTEIMGIPYTWSTEVQVRTWY